MLNLSNCRLLLLSAVIGGLLFRPESVLAQPENPVAVDLEQIREIYVPRDALDAALKADTFGAILPRDEFDRLVRKARESGQAAGAPTSPVVSSAKYSGRIEGERLVVDVQIAIRSFSANSEVQFAIAGWNVESSQLDDSAAWIARAGENLDQLRVFVPEAGAQQLTLRLSQPLRANASDQMAQVTLLGVASETFELALPAGRHLSIAGLSLERANSEDEATTYQIPVGGRSSLELRISDRGQSSGADLLTFANTAYGLNVLPGEISWSAHTELQVFGQTIDKLVCQVPQSLEITGVDSSGLESWELSDAPDAAGQTNITLHYRQSFSGTRTITFRGILSTAPDEPWQVPALQSPNLTSHVGVVVVQHPANLRLQAITTQGVRAVAQAPAANELFPGTQPQLLYEVWQPDFVLEFATALKEQEVQVAMTNILNVNARGLDLSVTLGLQTRLAPLFDLRFRLPAEYRIDAILVDGTPADWTTTSDVAGVNEHRIAFATPLLPNQLRTVSIAAHDEPEDWPVRDQTVRVNLPEVVLPQAAMIEAQYGISAANDLEIVPVELTGLDPARKSDVDLLNQKLQASGQTVRLGFTYQDTEFQGQLDVRRKPTLFTAESTIFLRIEREIQFAHLESLLAVSGGGFQQLTVNVSESAGDQLRFQLLPVNPQGGPVRIREQTSAEPADGMRTWTLQLDRYLQGEHRLVVEVQRPRGSATAFSPPRILFPQADAQSGFLAVESASDEHVTVTAADAAGTALASVDPVDFPPTYYHPQQRVVAGFRYVHSGWTLSVRTERYDRAALPTAVGHSAKITSVLGDDNQFQHQANIRFTAVGSQALNVTLPQPSLLWSTLLDDRPVESREADTGIQIPLQGLDSAQPHTLTVLYATPAPRLDQMGELKTLPPQVSVVTGAGQEQPLDILSWSWELHYPREAVLVESNGEFRPVRDLSMGTWLGHWGETLEIPDVPSLLRHLLILGAIALGFIILAKIFGAIMGRFGRYWGWVISLPILLILIGIGGLGTLAVLDGVGRDIARTAGTTSSTPLGAVVPTDGEDHFVVNGTDFRGGLQSQTYRRSRGADFMPPSAPPFSSEDPQAAPPTSYFNDSALPASEAVQSERAADQPNPAYAPYRDDQFNGIVDETLQEESPPAEQDRRLGASFRWQQTPGGLGGESTFEDGVQNGQAMPGLGMNPPQSGPTSDSGVQSGWILAGGGLLSMTFGLEIPREYRTQSFEYTGNAGAIQAPDLRLRYANHTTGLTLIIAIALGIAVLGWWLRRASRGAQALWLFLVVILPLAFMGIVPLLWQVVVEGVMWGGAATLVLWLVSACARCCSAATGRSANWLGRALVLLFALMMGTHAAHAQEGIPVPGPRTDVVASEVPYVVVPYDSLDELSSAYRLWVPARVYRELWQAEHPEDAPLPPGVQPQRIAQADYRAEVVSTESKGRVSIQARWLVIVLSDDTQTVPLPLKHVAIQQAVVDDEPAAIVAGEEGRTSVRIAGRGPHVVDARFEVAADINRSVGQFQLETFPVASGMLTFIVPESEDDLRVQVNGSTGTFQRITEDDSDTVAVPIDLGGTLTVSWQPESQQVEAGNLVQLESAALVGLSDAGLRVHSSMNVRVRQGSLNDLTFKLPADLAIQTVSGPDVAGWEISTQDEEKTLRVVFRRAITGETTLQAEMFQKLDPGTSSRQVNIPIPEPLDVARESGQVSLAVTDSLRLRLIEATGAQQIDLKQFQPALPPAPVEGTPQLAFRFASRPMNMTVEVARREQEVRASTLHGVRVGRRKVLIATQVVLNLSGSPQRVIEIALPQNYLPMDLVCAQAVDWYTREIDGQQRLFIELQSPMTGRLEIGLQGHLPRDPQATQVSLELPEPTLASRLDTQLAVWFDDSYQASVASAGVWRDEDVSKLPAEVTQLQPESPQFAFRTDKAPTPLEFQLTEATPTLNADAGVLIAVTEATIDYGLTLRWEISNAAASEFHFTAPDWLENLEFSGSNLRQVQSESLEGGRTRWSISLVEPAREELVLTAAATVPAPRDDTVQTPLLEFESVSAEGTATPLGAQRQFAVLVNLSSNQLVPADLAQFDSVSADRLPLQMPPSLVQQAMEITRVQAGRVPQWRIVRLENVAGTQAIVVSSTLSTALEMDGSWRTRAVYGVRNRGRQFLGLQLPEGSRVLSVFVRGKPARMVTTILQEQTVWLVALPQTSQADLSFDIEILLSGSLGRPLPVASDWTGRRISIPAPQVISPKQSSEFGLPVAQTVWTVHFPKELDAVPIENVNATNLTWNRDRAWLVQERQNIERYRADLSEMQRVLSDKSASKLMLKQAVDNLSGISRALQQQQVESDSLSLESEEVEKLQRQNRDLYGAVQKSLDDYDGDVSGNANGRFDSSSSASWGRSFILGNNSLLYEANQKAADKKESAESEQLFNFYSKEDARRGEAKSQSDFGDSNSRRSQLKDQLQQQAPIVQSKAATPFQNIPELNVAGRENWPKGTVAGLVTPQQQFTPSLDIAWEEGRQSGQPVRGFVTSGGGYVGGLSVAMAPPMKGQELAFSKVGGSPMLTLSVRPRQTFTLAIAAVWGILMLLAGIWVLRSRKRLGLAGVILQLLSTIALLMGAAGFLMLDGSERWSALAVFCIGAVVLVLIKGSLAAEEHARHQST